MFRKEYNSMNEQIMPDPSLSERVMKKTVPGRHKTFRPAAAVVAVLVVAVMAVPAMAAAMPWILEIISPMLGRELESVRRSDTANGISMEVVAASAWGNRAELVMRIEGEALIAPVGVSPNFRVDREGLKSITMYAVNDYDGAEEDQANGIYYYQVVVTYAKGLSLEELLDGEMTVRLDDIRVSGFASEEIQVPILLKDLEEVELLPVAELKKHGYPNTGWGDSADYPHGCELGSFVMKPTGVCTYDVTENLGLSAAAYIDGKLHVQMKAVNMQGKLEWSYWGPDLVDAAGNRAPCLYRNLFGRDGMLRIDYDERIFDIPPEELEDYTMVVRMEYHDQIFAGCEVTFCFSESEIMVE